jgi:hypothetical protein
MNRSLARRTSLLLLFSFLAVLACAAPAAADLVTWSLSGTLSDGGSISGSFVVDTSNPDVNFGMVTSWNITVKLGDTLFDQEVLNTGYWYPCPLITHDGIPAQPYTFTPSNSEFSGVVGSIDVDSIVSPPYSTLPTSGRWFETYAVEFSSLWYTIENDLLTSVPLPAVIPLTGIFSTQVWEWNLSTNSFVLAGGGVPRENYNEYSLTILSGEVTQVPIVPSGFLLGSGLLGLGLLGWRRQRA